MEKDIIIRLHKNFEECAHRDGDVEFWYARELQVLLGYDKWQNFETVIEKAKAGCTKAKQLIDDHFADVSKTIHMPKGASKEIPDTKLTRYACYLIAQNGDPRKEEIAFAMTYFAVQTRKQEILEKRLAEWERIQSREKLTLSERELSGILFERGVDNQGFARIRSQGDSALFGGNTTNDMKKKLNVPDKRALADFLPDITIQAKDLATKITNHNVKKDEFFEGETKIDNEHVKNNRNMRDMLIKNGIYPESLPADEDIKKLERRVNSEDKKLPKQIQKLK
ncbi:MAG: DNA damage-inducible protein D [Candidatus Magasanikbacteria bacterium RIFCSPHIGHO2_01_FULL_41_23]|uniref:DNA damage-inducible protein D n=1 Tax=Candidatus Magasanikbacteria bacterium RIFCSPLOWO2_01_FULL_40_15 TaxID=1798686 RepID=A0A1F6N0U3_9BACT|nr:MAG: DNA damage-inducible protein D [Candidatus Magasanikbacteria bacterium RIFCSPHIGHO2_01_FULL_41_23]OGH74627.1 MAG: DNA damage-inducible protein D [Candidatus Magasanikbacteria bacterium RIFCSPHIGHO2_12_FULL_41_16]OGH77340.1 MAG: DNA damage-inducible protein D [Candidatus Magasanikbacteria bacterium RIFCSPLOWO2_01_FULL_40_15]